MCLADPAWSQAEPADAQDDTPRASTPDADADAATTGSGADRDEAGEIAIGVDDENVEWSIEESEIPPYQPLLGDIDHPVYQTMKDAKAYVYSEVGLELALRYTVLYQVASGGISPRDVSTGSLRLDGFWHVGPPQQGENQMGVGFAIEHRADYTNNSGRDLANGIGSIWSPNDLSSGSFDRIRQIWWGQRFADGKLAYVLGKIDPEAYLSTSRFAGSTKTQFMAQPFAINVGAAYPREGLGGFFEFKPMDWAYVRSVISDGSVASSNPFFSFDDGDWFYSAEVGLEPQIKGLGQGNYRFTYFNSDTTTGRASSIGLSFDQDLLPWLGAFMRYNYTGGDAARIRNIFATGVSFIQPFGRKNDSAGVAVAWTDPVGAGLREEYSTEVYYRLELTDGIDISASVQAVFDPSANPSSDAVGIFGLRLNVLY